jgi:hypothetical protein
MQLPHSFAVMLLLAGSWTAPPSVHASDYGCTVLLCLSNPGGPKQYAQCAPSIDRLWHDLSRGRPFPTCDMADGNTPGNFAKQVSTPYDPCPAGLTPAPQGSAIVQGSVQTTAWSRPNTSGQPAISEALDEQGKRSGPQACVGQLVGSYAIGSADEGTIVAVYDKVVWLPYKSPRAIDVYIDNKLQSRVHW